MQAFLKNLGLGALAAAVAGVAAYLLDPANFAQLGVYAGLATTIAAFLADGLKKLADKFKGL